VIHREKPDYYLKIGIKDGKVINVDWSEMMKEIYLIVGDKKILKHVVKYLKQAIKFLKEK